MAEPSLMRIGPHDMSGPWYLFAVPPRSPQWWVR